LREVERSPDDEILLTELAIDNKDFITYEVSSVISIAEEEQANGKFRCYMEQKTKEFFIEIPDEGSMKVFTRSALITMMKLAEQAGAETVYVCVRKTVQKQEAYLKNFLFVGFERLTKEEQKKISMTRTHNILKCNLKSEEQDE